MGAANFLAWTRGATMLFPNSEEAATLAETDDPDAQAARLAAHYPLVVIKRGAAGCEAIEGERRWRVAAPSVKAVDSTGAGDAFVAAFLAAKLRGAPIRSVPRSGRRRRRGGDRIHRRRGRIASQLVACMDARKFSGLGRVAHPKCSAS